MFLAVVVINYNKPLSWIYCYVIQKKNAINPKSSKKEEVLNFRPRTNKKFKVKRKMHENGVSGGGWGIKQTERRVSAGLMQFYKAVLGCCWSVQWNAVCRLYSRRGGGCTWQRLRERFAPAEALLRLCSKILTTSFSLFSSLSLSTKKKSS